MIRFSKIIFLTETLARFNMCDFVQGENSYLYIKAAKSFFNVPREKLSPRPLRPRQINLEDVKNSSIIKVGLLRRRKTISGAVVLEESLRIPQNHGHDIPGVNSVFFKRMPPFPDSPLPLLIKNHRIIPVNYRSNYTFAPIAWFLQDYTFGQFLGLQLGTCFSIQVFFLHNIKIFFGKKILLSILSRKIRYEREDSPSTTPKYF
jgi:hypothetical protein